MFIPVFPCIVFNPLLIYYSNFIINSLFKHHTYQYLVLQQDDVQVPI